MMKDQSKWTKNKEDEWIATFHGKCFLMKEVNDKDLIERCFDKQFDHQSVKGGGGLTVTGKDQTKVSFELSVDGGMQLID